MSLNAPGFPVTNSEALKRRHTSSNGPLKQLDSPPIKQSRGHNHLTLTWREIPAWMRDNEYILSGYRREQNSVPGCIHSIFGYLHNESVNIHTHLWGAVLFVFFLFTLYDRLTEYPSISHYDSVNFAIFLLSTIICLSFSASYHTMTCHSQIMHNWCHTLDYAGIVVLIVGSFFPCVYYTFYCDPHLQVIYLLGITISGIGASYIVLSPTYSRPTHRGARTVVFVALGLFAILPVSHAIYAFGFYKLYYEMGLIWLITSGALYISGALIYANRLPERWFAQSSNRFFDCWLSSHQIFHVHVVLAALSHYACLLKAVDHRHRILEGVCST